MWSSHGKQRNALNVNWPFNLFGQLNIYVLNYLGTQKNKKLGTSH